MFGRSLAMVKDLDRTAKSPQLTSSHIATPVGRQHTPLLVDNKADMPYFYKSPVGHPGRILDRVDDLKRTRSCDQTSTLSLVLVGCLIVLEKSKTQIYWPGQQSSCLLKITVRPRRYKTTPVQLSVNLW
jgi:hypothetical protein